MIKVIIVDDEERILKSVVDVLKKNKIFKVIGKFTNPLTAYKKILKFEPDLVIADIDMPVMSGIELAEKISQEIKYIDFVFLTGYREYAVEAFQLNVLHYIMKPINEMDLVEILRRMMNSRRIKQKINDVSYKINIFDEFVVINSDNQRIYWPTVKVEELFALLLLNIDKGVDRWKLAHELWNIREVKDPLQNLYSSIYRLRKVFDDYKLPYTISNANERYQLEIANSYFDYKIYLKLIDIYKTLEINSNNIEMFNEIIEMYKGPIFGSKDYLWSLYERERLERINLLFLEKMRAYYLKADKKKEVELIDLKLSYKNGVL